MSGQAPYSIDDMARAGCTTSRGIRFWEEQELLGEVARSQGDTRRFTDEQMRRARIIAAAQFGGWKLDEIRQMIEEYDGEAYSAIVTRLGDQMRAAARLAEDLPCPVAVQAFDL